MRIIQKYLFAALTLFFMTVSSVSAQKITVQGPTQVANGDQFYLRYVVNTTDVKGFRLGNVPDAFEVLMGPSTSTSHSFSMVNGQTSQSSSVTYTYVLMATKNGTFVIPSAHATVNGKSVQSQALKITVSGQAPQRQQQGGGQRQQPRQQQQPQHISGNDLFIRVTANKQKVYEQEPILLTYKVYTQVDLTQLEGKMPDLNGFHTQEIPLPQQKQFHIETVNGKRYNCVTWSQYVMFPQMSGKLEIPELTFKGIVVQQNPNVDPFEAFFNGGSSYIEVKKAIKAPSVSINVMPLPQKPANFSGGVGQFDISATLDKNTVKAGDPVTLRFVVNGTGNMKLIKQPELQLPNDFDTYDPKQTDKTKLTASGLTGSVLYETLIVPRNKGKYTIPAMEFVYFDTKTSSYKTLTTQPLELNVEKGSGSSTAVMDYSQRNSNDISDIIMGVDESETPETSFFGSNTYMFLNALVIAAFIALLIIFRKRAIERADLTAMRGRKANKVAGKRLKKAAKLMAQQKGNEFYDEVLRALWGYVGDKLAMPVEQLSRDNIQQNLLMRNVSEDIVGSFIEAIDECEFARYAPGDPSGNMQKTYDKAVEAITNIEDGMKKKTSKSSVTTALMLFIMMACSINVCAETSNKAGATDAKPAASQNIKANADAAYRTSDYQKAILLYQQALQQGVSATLYNNIGNAYYRVDNIPMAILYYEKARKLEPMNESIIHSLEIARNKTIDKLPPESEMFFVQWYRALRNMQTIDGWATMAIASLIVSLLLFLCYLFIDNMAVRHISFYGSFVLIVLFAVSNLFAWQKKSDILTHYYAVVMSKEVTVKSSPTLKSPDACLIHEGTCVRITDDEMKGWYGIRLSDGREGWVESKDMKEI